MNNEEGYVDVVKVTGMRPQEDKVSCPLWEVGSGPHIGACKHFKDHFPCRYGLTDIRVPKDCPLPLTIVIKRKRCHKTKVWPESYNN